MDKRTEQAITLNNELTKFAYHWLKTNDASNMVAVVAVGLLNAQMLAQLPTRNRDAVQQLVGFISVLTEAIPENEAQQFFDTQGASLEDILNAK